MWELEVNTDLPYKGCTIYISKTFALLKLYGEVWSLQLEDTEMTNKDFGINKIAIFKAIVNYLMLMFNFTVTSLCVKYE